MSTFRAVCRPALVAVAGVAILLSGCSQGTAQSEGPQAQKDTIKQQQASPTADAQQLKDDAAKAAKAKTVATNAAATAAAKAAAAKAVKARTAIVRCNKDVSAGPNTSCVFAKSVLEGMYKALNHGRAVITGFDVYSPVTGVSYKMKCKEGVSTPTLANKNSTVCRGGNNAVVYITAPGNWGDI